MYGLTSESRKLGLFKIKKQKEFFNNNYFTVGSDVIKMADVVKNPFHNSSKYIAELNHRVWSLNQYAQNKNLKPIFGTLTLPTEFHKKIANKRDNLKYANKHLIPDFEKIYNIKTKKQTLTYMQYKDFTPNAGAKELSKMFKKLLDLRVIRNIPKNDRCYFRVYEPHKDGTPHLHFSLFVPSHKLDEVYVKVSSYFNSEYSNLRTDFQININNPVSYLMKYILKTFDDLRTGDNNISDLSLWYIINKITRFYTSRTLISMEVYRKLNGRYDLLELTYMYQNRELTVYEDTETKKIVAMYDNVGQIYNKRVVTLEETNKRIELKYKKKKIKPMIFIDGEQFIEDLEGNLRPFNPIISVNCRSTETIIDNINELISNSNYDTNYYGVLNNELIYRDLNIDNFIPISEYTSFQ